MILEIQLHNWTSHKDTKIPLPAGNILFLGSIGSGKSSVIDALTFALFGKLPPSIKKNNLQDVVREREKIAKVSVKFEVDGDVYEVIREIRNKQSNAFLKKNGSYILDGPARVTHYIEELLGIDHETFCRVMLAPQSMIDELLSQKPKERKLALDRLMGIEELQEIVDKTTRVSNKLKKRLQEINIKLDEQKLKRYEKELQENSRSLEKKRNRQKELEIRLAELEKETMELEKEVKSLEEKRKKKEEMIKKLKEIEGRISELPEEEIDEKKILEVRKEVVEKKRKLEEVDKKLKAIRSKEIVAIKLMKEREEKKQLLEKLKDELEKSEKELASIILNPHLEEEAVKLKEQRSKIKTELNDVVEKIKEIKELGPKCPLCLQRIDASYKSKLLMEIEEKKETLTARLREIEKVLVKKEKELDIERAKREKAERLKGRIAFIRKKILEIKIPQAVNVDQLAGEKEKLEKMMKELMETTLEKEQLLKELIEKKRKIELKRKLKKLALALKNELSKIDVDEEKLEQKKAKYMEKLKMLEKAKTEFLALKEGVKLLEQNLELLRQEIKRLQELKSLLEKGTSLQRELNIFKDVLIEAQKEVRKSVLERINYLLPIIWRQIYPYTDYQDIKIDYDGDYKFVARHYGRQITFEARASGGERAIFSLTIRIIFSKIFAKKLSLLILDEPTLNLDDESIERFAEALTSKHTKQVIVISHDERLKEFNWDRVAIFKRPKTGGANDYTVIEWMNYS